MKFIQHFSNSAGNLYEAVASNGKRLLIDPGVTWKKLQQALNYDLSNIVGALCSHEHFDHSKSVKEVMRSGITVYSSDSTLDALGIYQERRAIGMLRSTIYPIGPFDVVVYDSNHDAVEPLLFKIKCDNEFMLFATDTSHINQRFSTPFSIIAIECSYDKAILQHRVDTNDINETLAKRLLTSHMEKQEAIRYLSEFCNMNRCHEIHLLHMSGDNIDKAQTKTDFEKRFFVNTVIA